MASILDRYSKEIAGIISCTDRLILLGTLPGICYAQGMGYYLDQIGLDYTEYPDFAQKFTDSIREHVAKLAEDSALKIEFVRSPKGFRKEARVQEVLRQRGDALGIVHILSAMEACPSYGYSVNKATGKSYIKPRTGKCLHYYIYFIDNDFGLCYLRIPTWLPATLQFYCNGHSWLAKQLGQQGVEYTQIDNAFLKFGDWEKAQGIADSSFAERLHRTLDEIVRQFCPSMSVFNDTYHWSILQAEYATDIVFHCQQDLAPLYQNLAYTAIHAVKPDNVATFLGKRLDSRFDDEAGNDFHTRIEGTRIKHRRGPASIKMYDKHGIVLRIETTINDISFFQHYRTVEHRDRTTEKKMAPMKKTLYSLFPLQELLKAANRRYLEFISELDDPTPGIRKVEKISEPAKHNDRTFRGFNLFSGGDLDLFRALVRGEFAISGMRNSWLRKALPGYTPAQISRLIKRLHLHGLIKKVGKTYKYHLTTLGKQVCAAALKLRELVVIPSMATEGQA